MTKNTARALALALVCAAPVALTLTPTLGSRARRHAVSACGRAVAECAGQR